MHGDWTIMIRKDSGHRGRNILQDDLSLSFLAHVFDWANDPDSGEAALSLGLDTEIRQIRDHDRRISMDT